MQQQLPQAVTGVFKKRKNLLHKRIKKVSLLSSNFKHQEKRKEGVFLSLSLSSSRRKWAEKKSWDFLSHFLLFFLTRERKCVSSSSPNFHLFFFLISFFPRWEWLFYSDTQIDPSWLLSKKMENTAMEMIDNNFIDWMKPFQDENDFDKRERRIEPLGGI